MKNTPYNSFYYWENLIMRDEQIWENSFREQPLTRDSVFLHYVIVNSYSGGDNQWVYFPNIKALLGFIEFVYLPTVFYAWLFGSEDGGLIIPVGTVDELLEVARHSKDLKDKEKIPVMERNLTQIRSLWELNSSECIAELKRFTVGFNEHWVQELDLFFYFNVFKNPTEVGQYIIEAYEQGNLIDIAEERLGLTKDEWLDVCRNVYDNEFMKRKFVEILNNRVVDMI